MKWCILIVGIAIGASVLWVIVCVAMARAWEDGR